MEKDHKDKMQTFEEKFAELKRAKSSSLWMSTILMAWPWSGGVDCANRLQAHRKAESHVRELEANLKSNFPDEFELIESSLRTEDAASLKINETRRTRRGMDFVRGKQ